MNNAFIVILIVCLGSCGIFAAETVSLKKQSSIVGVLGDLEGNWERFEDFLRNGDIFEMDAKGEITLKPGRKFVFLGDAVDRGKGSLKVVETLVQLKEKYPDDVTIILGNHDITKMRILDELSDEKMAEVPKAMYGYVRQMMKRRGRTITQSQFERHLPQFNTKVNRLKWLLAQTMGAPKAFELRKMELKKLNPAELLIEDELVVLSYIDELSEGGNFRKFLSYGQLAAVVDNTLYTHGAITKQNYGHIPGRSETIIDLNQWIKELNGWFKSEVHKWQRGASATHLLKYVTPNSSDYSNNESVTFARFFDNKGNYKQLPEAIIRSLKKYIARIVVGHTPIGEVPVLIREDGIELLAADTSGAKNPAMNSKILIQEQVVSLEKQMPNGRKFQMVARLGDNESPFGKLATNDFRIIGTLDNDSYLLHNNVNRYEEYVNIYKKVSPPDLQFKKTAQASLSKQVGCVHAASALL